MSTSYLSRALALALTTLTLSLAACGGGGADQQLVGDANELGLVVDANFGSDNNPGTSELPFKTITHALQVVEPGEVVHVRNGMYDEDNGEVFPLRLPPSVHLAGPTASRITGNRPMIVGTGDYPTDGELRESATLLPGIGSTVSALHLMAPAGSLGFGNAVIAVREASVTIRSCVVEMGVVGIFVTNNSSRMELHDTRISGAQIGVYFDQAGHNSRVERTTCRSNVTGVRVSGTVALDLGGGIQMSAGRNIFAGNAEVDLYVASGTDVMARNNFWDGSPDPSEYLGSNPPIGIDVWRRGPTATVDTAGALMNEPATDGAVVPPADGGVVGGVGGIATK